MEKLTALDRLFDYRARASDGCAWFKIVRGRVPVLVSAPHACMHQREGVVKLQEEYTGALAVYLADAMLLPLNLKPMKILTGRHKVIIKTQ